MIMCSFNACFTRFEIFRKRLTIHNVVAKNKVTQEGARARFNHSIDEPRSSNRQHRYS